jgi:cobalamin biosynthesis Mg chelatase CobN
LQPNGHDLALKYLKTSTDEECGVPAEPKDCASPLLKGSPALQQLLAEAKSHKTEKAAADAKSETAAGAKSETAAGAKSETAAGAKQEHGAEEHSSKPEEKSGKTAKEGGGGVKEGAAKVQERAKEMEAETQLIEHRANFYDAAELFLEISIVLCSIALLSAMRIYWKLSFISTAVGILLVVWGYVLR